MPYKLSSLKIIIVTSYLSSALTSISRESGWCTSRVAFKPALADSILDFQVWNHMVSNVTRAVAILLYIYRTNINISLPYM